MKTLNAYAKLNLLLDFYGKRTNGYHEVNFVNTPISLATELNVKYNDSGEIRLKSENNIPLDENNFIHKIISRIKENYSLDFGIEVEIKKGKEFAGLGIGSSETAKILNELNEKFQLKLMESERAELIKDITSDGCFSIYEKPAVVRGFGERVFPLRKIEMHGVVFGVPAEVPEKKTKWMYGKITKEMFTPVDCLPIVKAIMENNWQGIKSNLHNFFEKLDIPEYKESFDLIKELRKDGYGSILAGSGPTVFAICKNKEQAEELSNKYKYDSKVIEAV